MKSRLYYIVLILIYSNFGCSNDKTKSADPGVIVTIVLEETGNIHKIQCWTDDGQSHTFAAKDINETSPDGYETIATYLEFAYVGAGEHTCTICVYKSNDTICTSFYTEGGYEPLVTYSGNSIDVGTSTGNLY